MALDVKVLREDNTEVEMKENVDEATISYNSVMSDDKNYGSQNEDFGKYGYQEQQIAEDGIVDVEENEETEDSYMDEMSFDEE